MDKLSFKFIKALNLVYIYLFIFIFSFIYIIKVNKIFSEVVDYLDSYFKKIGSIKLIINI